MKVLLLSPYPWKLDGVWTDETILNVEGVPSDSDWNWAEWVVSFGFRKIIPVRILKKFPKRIINIHISVLPWNRGSDPNFWSWFDKTPKGVSIHWITDKLDAGALLAQTYDGNSNGTLRTTYDHLHYLSRELLRTAWPRIKDGSLEGVPQEDGGTFHKKGEAQLWIDKLPSGWDTPVREVEKLGELRKLRELGKLRQSSAA